MQSGLKLLEICSSSPQVGSDNPVPFAVNWQEAQIWQKVHGIRGQNPLFQLTQMFKRVSGRFGGLVIPGAQGMLWDEVGGIGNNCCCIGARANWAA